MERYRQNILRTDIKALPVSEMELATLIRVDTEEYAEKIKSYEQKEKYRDIPSLKGYATKNEDMTAM